MLDPSKMPLLQQQIWDLIKRAHLDRRPEVADARRTTATTPTNGTRALTAEGTPVTLAQMQGREVSHLIQDLDGYLCELAGPRSATACTSSGRCPRASSWSGCCTP